MILKPGKQDIKAIGYYLGKIIIGLSCTMAIPILVGLLAREINPVLDFLIGLETGLIIGLILIRVFRTDRELNWMQGMIVVSLAWVAVMFLGAIPMHLSGHWKSYLDACFDSMSGFATTGLTLVQNLDHMSLTHNLWRHLTMFIGGQGIVIIALSFFVKGASGAFKLYVGEARDERIMPNVIHTSRFIWLVSITYLILGTLVLSIIGNIGGMKPFSAFFHGLCIFMAAFDTGGFAPQSQSILYYRSFAFEIVTVILMILGALNFKLHYHIWVGNRKEIAKNIETVTFFISIMAVFSIVAIGLKQAGIYPQAVMFFRKGFFQLVSGHSGTGFQTIYPSQFSSEWNNLSLVGVILAMGLGGAVCSTTGAIKMLRVGIIFKAFLEDIKKIILPERAIVIQKFHHIKEVFLQNKQVRSALLITLAYLILYFLGACIGMFYGHPFLRSLFESTSAAGNVGLSCGITSATMPVVLKVTYILQMWAGRLEFISVFTLIGFFVAAVKGK
ncbi:MAG: TrkH family potassium uptake protein [Candidatus Omnitrophica bacterium]|nr:TrkH family potassium uptake protein [Candidatus Omnitrophota bacterium]